MAWMDWRQLDEVIRNRVGGGGGGKRGYSARTPAMSSTSSVRLLVLQDDTDGNMVALADAECPRPSACPNSCAAMSSM